MVEPQEPKIFEQILTQANTSYTEINQLGAGLPAELLAVAKKKVEGFRILKGEIDRQMSQIHEGISKVQCVIRANVFNKKNQDGLLTSGEASYLKCLQMQHVQLEEILRKDEAHWAQNQENSKKRAAGIGKKIETIIKK